jgi:hypothetical protein
LSIRGTLPNYRRELAARRQGIVPTRRDFLAAVLTAVPAYALLGAAGAAADRGMGARHWIARQQQIALALAEGEIGPLAWQVEVERLAGEVDLDRLMAEVARAAQKAPHRALPNYPARRKFYFRDEDGAKRRFRYKTVLFEFRRHDVITPHAHRNMVSAHMVVEGAFRVRTFDHVRDADGALVIRPRTDGMAELGHVTSMSQARNNVHWFVARAERAVTFDVLIDGLDTARRRQDIIPLDPLRATPLADGTLRAPILSHAESSRLYTADL